ncbi:rab-GTPase-TBC domain-domain-containing protein [Lobosporangium transversale]|uniref:Rab-GTPase-TBC domain-domain-containing protein n=1 Tax=Lobosporangium transversale TaxID=64571 RepID=A0A1Y2GEW3_9FUNG|nr:rab-GTPase-TBC domain-domain-containing protein [Lobosporangium transversale]ORZ08841.1 rab-GTPase-TBC domain-domain-containing protein [Lobosporangium transversale]|eukprot:XP_021878624.1 rab-GTPase-TBC domain-domain-containing protein [Lobosporangium transversale]
MATFATCTDLHRHPSTRNAGLAAISFCANDNADDELQGVPPATSYIFGQCQFLKSLSHPNLCEYLDAIKGKRDRVFVVQEHYSNSLDLNRITLEKEQESTSPRGQSITRIRKWAAQIIDALIYLNSHGIVHRALTISNILLTEDDFVKLSNYGLYYMTKGGTLVQFSIGEPHYLSPMALAQPYTLSLQDYSTDLWSVGVIMTELFLGVSFWRADRSDLDELIASLFALRKLSTTSNNWIQDCSENVGINPIVLSFLKTGRAPDQDRVKEQEREQDKREEQIQEQADQTSKEENELNTFICFLRACLSLEAFNSIEPAQIRNHDFFKALDVLHREGEQATGYRSKMWHQKPYIQSTSLPDYEGEVKRLRDAITQRRLALNEDKGTKKHPTKNELLYKLPLSQVFYLWKLAGGDVEAQFRRNGRLVGTPPIQLLPKVVHVAETKDERYQHHVRDIADLFSDVPCILPLDNLESEILKSIHEPNKDQFSWDTDYFLFSDPDEMNFLQGTMGDDKYKDRGTSGKDDDFLYPDSMRFTNMNVAFRKAPASLSSSTPSNTVGASASGGAPSLAQQPNKARVKVPLAIREKDLGYQYQRLSMFTDLLLQYPASRAEILHHSKIDIPPLLRGKVWAAILGVVGDYQEVYNGYDKYTEKPTDRQIELDVPRCHQYNQLMFSPAGHEKMKRLLKCWVKANENQAYWQGLDSCCAPFLTLNFNDEALAFACIQLFLPKFLKDMFLHDNSQVIHEYLAVFKHLLSYHDPELSSHLDHIRFIPQLYAIPWFMTLFTHIFPLDKVYHLWDKILVGPSSLPLFVGIAILQQFRQQLLRSEFNEAISIFSESFPGMDIEKCIETALAMCRVTPPSTCWLSYDQESREIREQLHLPITISTAAIPGKVVNGEVGGQKPNGKEISQSSAGPTAPVDHNIYSSSKASSDHQELKRPKEIEKRISGGVGVLHWWEEPLSIETMDAELAPRIHRSDFVKLRQQAMVIDIRPEEEFCNGHYPLSIQMVPGQLGLLVHILGKLKKNYLVVIANRGDSGPEFASALVRHGFSRVALLMGGIDALRITEPVMSLTSNSAIPGNQASPSLSTVSTASTAVTGTTTTTIITTPTICSCKPFRQAITVQSKIKDEVAVQKCKTPFTQKKMRTTMAA